MIYVLTRNYHQYSGFLKDLRIKSESDRRYYNVHNIRNGKDIRYIQDDRSIRGQHNQLYMLVGEYWMHPHHDIILDLMRIAGFTEIYRDEWISNGFESYLTIKYLMVMGSRTDNKSFTINDLI